MFIQVRDETLRYTRKVFDQPQEKEEEAIAKYEKLLYVPVTTNRGSCGALNANMVKYMEEISSPYAVAQPRRCLLSFSFIMPRCL